LFIISLTPVSSSSSRRYSTARLPEILGTNRRVGNRVVSGLCRLRGRSPIGRWSAGARETDTHGHGTPIFRWQWFRPVRRRAPAAGRHPATRTWQPAPSRSLTQPPLWRHRRYNGYCYNSCRRCQIMYWLRVYLLNISEFVYFVWGLSPPKRRVIRRRNFARTRVPTMSKTSTGFMSKGVVVTKK